MRISLLFSFFILSLVSTAQFDTLWLKNGQMVYGELKTVEAGLIKFDAEVIGVFEVKHYEVATLKATTNVYKIKQLHGHDISGWILPADTGSVKIADLLDTIRLPMYQIVNLSSFETDPWERWSGVIGAGYSYTRSSNISRYNADLSLHYKGEDVNFDASATSIITGQGDSLTRDREEATAMLNRFVAKKFSVFGGATYQRNYTLGLEYRYQGALGMMFIDYFTNQVKFSTGTGAVFNTERSFQGQSLESVELPVFVDFTFFKYRNPKISLIVSQYVYVGLTTAGRFRHDGEIRLAWEVFDDFNLTLTFYDNFDNQSPSTGAALLDYGIVSGFSYSF